MSYDISWHRTSKTVHKLKTWECEEEVYFDDDDEKIKEAKELHSGVCGYFETCKKPFSYESTGLNITSNLYDMFSWAINDNPELDWKETIHGKKGEEVEPVLRKALQKMKENETEVSPRKPLTCAQPVIPGRT